MPTEYTFKTAESIFKYIRSYDPSSVLDDKEITLSKLLSYRNSNLDDMRNTKYKNSDAILLSIQFTLLKEH